MIECSGGGVMSSIEIIFETHSWSADNERALLPAGSPAGCQKKASRLRENSASVAEGTILLRSLHLIYAVPSRPPRLPSADLGFQSTKISACASATTAFSTGCPWRAS